jgi:hypothetical protein
MFIKSHTPLPRNFNKGTVFFEGDEGKEGNEGTGGGGGGGKTDVGTKTFTEQQVNEMIQARLARVKGTAAEELAKELGIENIADAKKVLADAKAIADEKKTADERAREANEAREKAAAEKEAQAELKSFKVDVKSALTEEGFDKKKIDRIMGMLTVKPGATEEEIAADVKALKGDFPELFGKSGGLPDSDAGKGGGGSGGRGNGKDPFAVGAERAKQMAGESGVPSLFKGILS